MGLKEDYIKSAFNHCFDDFYNELSKECDEQTDPRVMKDIEDILEYFFTMGFRNCSSFFRFTGEKEPEFKSQSTEDTEQDSEIVSGDEYVRKETE
jgi:hypothetical protein